MKIIIINGQGGVGKDTFVKYCANACAFVHNESTINPIKYFAKQIGWKGEKTERDRKFLSDFKDLLTNYNDYPYNATVKKVVDIQWDYHYYNLPTNQMLIFIHCREPREINRWKKEHGARTLIIRRRTVEQEHGNHADDEVLNMVYDYTIYNEGTLHELRTDAENFVKKVLNEKWESKV